jgi:dipeptidyl-peptidase-4
MRVLFALALLLACGGPAPAQDPSRLTLDRIFNSNEFRGASVGPFEWLEGHTGYTTFIPSETVRGGQNLVLVDPQTGKKSALIWAESLIRPGSTSPLHIADYDFSKDLNTVLIFTNTQRVWRRHTRGDYWVLDRTSNKLTKLGGDAKPSTLMFAKLAPDGKRAGYVRDNNLYVENLSDGKITQLTQDGSANIINGTFDWVYEEELDCRDGWRWSPDGQHIAYWQLDTTGVPVFTMINNTDGMYPKLISFPYPKTGEKNSACRVGILPAAGGDTRWINLPGDSREHYIARMEWSKKGDSLLLQRLNRLQNENHVLRVDAKTGEVRTLWIEKDEAWVDLHDHGLIEHDDGSFTWISDRDGWRQVFHYSRDGSSPRCLTPGQYDIIQLLHVDRKQGHFYFTASPKNATQKYLFRCRLDHPGEPERLTPADLAGTHNYRLAPDGRLAIHSWSRFGVPSRTELVSLPDHKTIRNLNDNSKLQANLNELHRADVEFLKLEIGKGVSLDAWLMKPPGFDPSKKYPLFFHVYGEPLGVTVNDDWDGNGYLWHLYLTQQGYMVASIENRGTNAPHGRAWRKAAYKKIGVLASTDQAAATKELLKRPYLDSKRVGIWGWSGGGTMTLNQLFRHPDLYHTGIAVASVPDMRLYDTIYQERYMGLPKDNADAYRAGSPITHAGQLKGHLLLIHGTGDDNVHYQGVEKLMNTLIAANKPFTMMAYPNRSHGISEGRGTTRHLYELMTRYLLEHLPPGPRN